MQKKWSEKTTGWITKEQERFEQYLKDNGFEITGYRYYKAFNEYRIEKDGCEIEYRVHNGAVRFKYLIMAFEDYWNTSAKNHKKEASNGKV